MKRRKEMSLGPVEIEERYAFAAYKPKLTAKEAKASRGDWFSTKDNKINGELENISKGVSPFEHSGSGSIQVKDAIELCQKAYWNVAIFRSTIDIQTEFSNSTIHFRSKNKRVAKFFEKWYEKIGGWSLGERFFREWFRSGNLFVYRFNGILNVAEYRKFTRAAVGEDKIPLKYVILNPADIVCLGGSSFVNAEYGKVLNRYEVERLKNATTKDEIEFLDSLDEKTRKSIKSGGTPTIKLSQEDLTAIFCGKQDYEALAVPMYYPVLPDIDLKLEFKKAEKVLARTIDYAVLLITAGEKDGGRRNLDILQDITELFSAESVGRVIVSDYSTEGEWLIPDLNKVFGSQKFECVNEDIANGLFNIFYSSDKFANSLIKTQIFLERLNQAREAYLNYFLMPQIREICETLNFSDVPTVEFEDINLNNDLELKKLYVHMAEIGALTPEETIRALDTGMLPLPEDSVENQQDFKKLKDQGLYQSLINPPKEEGRPTGSKAPQKHKVGPIGASAEQKFSLSRVSENLREFYEFVGRVEDCYKEKNKIIRLSKKNKQICKMAAEEIAMHQPKSKWEASIASYLINPIQDGDDLHYDKVLEIMAEHNISSVLGAVLANSIVENNE